MAKAKSADDKKDEGEKEKKYGFLSSLFKKWLKELKYINEPSNEFSV